MGFWNELPPELFSDMKPHEVTARELQKQIVELYDLYRINGYTMLNAGGNECESARLIGGAEVLETLYLYFFGGVELLRLNQLIEKKIEESE